MQEPHLLSTAFGTAHNAVAASIRPLEASDWQAFRGWAEYVCISHGHGDEMARKIKSTPDETWQQELAQKSWKFFAAFEDKTIISLGRVGSTHLYPNACEALLEVVPAYKGQGIGTHMYFVLRNYVAHHHPGQDMIARILPSNTASRRAAEKAGLVYSGYTEAIINGKEGYMIYKASTPGLGPQDALSL